ncbi:SDR family NAD(P)-dependent oxidoreductase [bacterium]|nr:SDR family NAD(P)-dependent oxidoreductase [bacterium]
MKKFFITGGAGFIGSNLVKNLLSDGHSVTVYDNLSLGKEEFIKEFFGSRQFCFIKADLLDSDQLQKAIKGHETVFHLAANSDISFGAKYTDVDLKQGTLATYNVLETMRLNTISQIIFASTSAVYGEAKKLPSYEDDGPLFPISLYGASKLACEGMLSAFCHNYGMKAWIFRFGNIVGRNGTHGALVDFIKKLRTNPTELEVLGDGKQAKPYLHVSECVSGMLYGHRNSKEYINYFHLACDGATDVTTIAKTVIEEMGLKNVNVRYTGGERGWQGDVPQVRLSPDKLAKLGWRAQYSSDEAVRVAVKDLLMQL